MIISDNEAMIRAWVELNTIGRDEPEKPLDRNIQYLADLIKIIDQLRLGCPFDRPNLLRPEDPCPVCGDIGTDNSGPSNCISINNK